MADFLFKFELLESLPALTYSGAGGVLKITIAIRLRQPTEAESFKKVLRLCTAVALAEG